MTNEINGPDAAYQARLTDRDEYNSPVEVYRRANPDREVVATGGQGTPESPATLLSIPSTSELPPDQINASEGQPGLSEPLGHTASLLGQGIIQGTQAVGEVAAVPGQAVRGFLAGHLNKVLGTNLTAETLADAAGQALSDEDPATAAAMSLLTSAITDPLSYFGLGGATKVEPYLKQAFESMPGLAAKAKELAASIAPELKVAFKNERGSTQVLPDGVSLSEKGFAQRAGKTLTHQEVSQLGEDIIKQHLETQPAIIQQALDESGFASKQLLLLVTRATIGAGVGASVGDSENAIRNALVGAGLGVLATPALLTKLATVVSKSNVLQKQAPLSKSAAVIALKPGENPLRLSNPKLTPDSNPSGFKQVQLRDLTVDQALHPDAVNPAKVQKIGRASCRERV